MDFESTPDTAPNLTVDTEASMPGSERSTGENTPTGVKTPVKPSLKFTGTDNYNDNEDHGDDEGEGEGKGDSDNSRNGNGNGNKKKAAKKNSKKKNRTLKWDEAKIQEHDQLRGTRMKIEEPNTPFAHYDSGSETDGSLSSARGNANASNKISWDALTNKLEAHAAIAGNSDNAALFPPSSPSSHGHQSSDGDGGGHTTDEEDEDQKRERQRLELKRLAFQEHRKRHYNEMDVVRRFRRDCPDGEPTSNGHGHTDEDEDEDDTDEEEDNENDGDDENE